MLYRGSNMVTRREAAKTQSATLRLPLTPCTCLPSTTHTHTSSQFGNILSLLHQLWLYLGVTHVRKSKSASFRLDVQILCSTYTLSKSDHCISFHVILLSTFFHTDQIKQQQYVHETATCSLVTIADDKCHLPTTCLCLTVFFFACLFLLRRHTSLLMMMN